MRRGGRKQPVRHRVRTRHPRYTVPNYMRGHGQPLPQASLEPTKPTYREKIIEHEAWMRQRGQGVNLRRRHVIKMHHERSLTARRVDEAIQGQVTDNFNVWMKHPNRYDVLGVDYFPVPTKEGDPDWNIQAIGYALDNYYGTDIHGKVKYVLHADPDEYEKAYGSPDVSFAFALSDTDPPEIHFSPRATRLITEGKIRSHEDFHALTTIAHEFEHIRGHVSGRAFEEGSTELLADRFGLLALQMDTKLRDDLRTVHGISYRQEVQTAGGIALIVNNYKEEEAIKWLKRIRGADKKDKKKMQTEAEKKLAGAGIIPKDLIGGLTKPKQLLSREATAWNEAYWLRGEEEPIRRQLGWFTPSTPQGVLDVTTGLPNPQVMENLRRRDPEKYQKALTLQQIKDREKTLSLKAKVLKAKREHLEKNIQKHPFLVMNGTPESKDLHEKVTAHIKKTMPNEYLGSWWINV